MSLLLAPAKGMNGVSCVSRVLSCLQIKVKLSRWSAFSVPLSEGYLRGREASGLCGPSPGRVCYRTLPVSPCLCGHPRRQYSTRSGNRDVMRHRGRLDPLDNPYKTGPSLDKRVHEHLRRWDTDKAVELVVKAAKSGEILSGSSRDQMLQHLAVLGNFKAILDLEEIFLSDNALRLRRYHLHLADSFINSASMQDALMVINILYDKYGQQYFHKMVAFYTLITMAILDHFPEHLPELQDFTTRCQQCTEANHYPLAHLWKCHILLGQFDKAVEMEISEPELTGLIPAMVTSICNPHIHEEHRDVNLPIVLTHLLHRQDLKLKAKLRLWLHEKLVIYLCNHGSVEEIIEASQKAHQEDCYLRDHIKPNLTAQMTKASETQKHQLLEIMGDMKPLILGKG